MGIGYFCVALFLVALIVAAVFAIKDRVQKKTDAVSDLEARLSVRLASINKKAEILGDDIQKLGNQFEELGAQLSSMETIIDQFRPAPGFEPKKAEGESS